MIYYCECNKINKNQQKTNNRWKGTNTDSKETYELCYEEQ